MGLFIKLILLYFVIRFVVRVLFPSAVIFNRLKKRADELQNQVNSNKNSKSETSLYESKGEYIDYEDVN